MNMKIMSQVQVLPAVTAFLQRDHGHFINGKMIQADGPTKIDIVNPATEAVISQISLGNHIDVDKAVISAHQAFKTSWAVTTPYERGQKLLKLADLMEKYGEELAQLESLSTGKLINLARHLEVQQSVIFILQAGQPKSWEKPCNLRCLQCRVKCIPPLPLDNLWEWLQGLCRGIFRS